VKTPTTRTPNSLILSELQVLTHNEGQDFTRLRDSLDSKSTLNPELKAIFYSLSYLPSLVALNPTPGNFVLITKLEQITLRLLKAIAKLAQTGFNLGCPLAG
jgi:aspartyl/asparaginyl beta-hydroxylase (cupin superfamily)